MAAIVEFECHLGGVVILDCEASFRFGKADRSSLKVSYQGRAFDCEGIVIDYEGEFLPMRTYLLGHAQKTYDEVKHGAKKAG